MKNLIFFNTYRQICDESIIVVVTLTSLDKLKVSIQYSAQGRLKDRDEFKKLSMTNCHLQIKFIMPVLGGNVLSSWE